MNSHQDIPADDLQHLQKLLQLKNHEKPADGYFEDFLEEFHRRQRASAVAKAPTFGERLASWVSGLGAAKWAYGAGLAYALLFLGFVLMPDRERPDHGIATETEEILPGDRRLEHVELEKQQPKPENGEKEDAELLEMLPKDF